MPSFNTTISADERARYRAAGAWGDKIITDLLFEAVAATPGKIAVIDSRGSTTYTELARQVERCAFGLIAQGITPGDAIAVQLPNWVAFMVLHLAATRVGAITTLITPISRDREVAHMLRISEAKLLVIPREFRGYDFPALAKRVAPQVKTLVVGGAPNDSGMLDWDAFMNTAWEAGRSTAERAAELDALRPGADEVTEIVFTSGATGEPKGVLHTNNTILAPQWQMAKSLRLTRDDVIHIASTVAHQTGFLGGIRLPIQVGATVVMQDVWQPEAFIELIEKHRINVSNGSATFLLDMLRAKNLQAHDVSSFRIFRCGGGPIPPALVVEAGEKLPRVTILRGWGQSENGVVTLTRIGDAQAKLLETDGCAQPGMQVRIADGEGQPLPPNTEGRLQCRGPFQFAGYARQETLTQDSYIDGWFDTGDLAAMDAEGYIRITGRAKDIIIRGGENIPVKYVEDVLYENPNVQDAAIVGMPDQRLGERACAFVICRPGKTFSMSTMQTFLGEKGVAKQWWPERLEIAAELPRTANGKIRKADLRARLASEKRA